MPGRTRIAEAEIIARDRTGAGVKSAIGNFQQLHDVVRDNWWGVRNLGDAFAGVGAVIAGGLGVAAKAAIDFETGMAAVARTTYEAQKANESAADAAARNAAMTAQIGQQLREIAISTPVGTDRLTAIASEAGALGVAAGDVAEFTRTIAMLTSTTNLTDASAAQLARIGGVMGITADATDNLGSAILFAGRSLAATETEIVRFAQYLAPVVKAANGTTGELIALSAVFPSLGARADSARTSLSKTIADIGQAMRGGGEEAALFAAVAGKSIEEYSEIARKNGVQATLLFIEGLNKAGVGSEKATIALEKLGIVETRQLQSLRALAAAVKSPVNENLDLRTAIEAVSNAYAENTELQRAYENVTGTTSAQIGILKNQVTDIAIALGTLMLPAIKFVVGALQDIILGISSSSPLFKFLAVSIMVAVGAVALMAAGFLLLAPRVILVMGAYKELTRTYNAFAVSAANASAILAAANNTTATSTARAAFAYGRMSAAQREAAFAAFTAANNQKVANAVQGHAVKINELMTRVTQLSAVAKGHESRATALLAGQMAALSTQRQAEAAAAARTLQVKRLEVVMAGQLARAQALEAAGRSALAARASAAAAATGAQIRALQAQAAGHLQAARAAGAQATALAADAAAAGRMTLAVQGQIVALRAEEAALYRSANAARVDAEAKNVATAATTRLATASGILGRVMGKLMTPLLLVFTALSLAGVGMAKYGQAHDDLANAAERNARFQGQFAEALKKQRDGSANAVRDFILQQAAAEKATEAAEKYGITLEQMYAMINGSASAADTGDFAGRLIKDAKAGSKEAARLDDFMSRASEAIRNAGLSAQNASQGNKANTDALKAQAKSAQDAKKAMDELRETNNRINQALLALPEAILAQREALLAVKDAQEEYNKALAASKNNAEAIADAEDNLIKARNDHRKALRDVARAEKDLSTARQRARDDYEEAQDSFLDAQDKLLDAQDKVIKTEQKLAELREGPSTEQLTKATNKLTEANLKLRKSQFRVRDAQYMLNYLMAEGASQRDIEEAQLALDEANHDVAESTTAIADAQKELNELVNPDPKKIADAERALASARRDVAEAIRDLRKAEDELIQSRTDLANDTAYKDAEAELAEARMAVRDATKEISEAEQALKDARSGKSAARDLAEAELALEKALYNSAKANVEVQKQTALSRGEMFGAGREARALAAELGKVGSSIPGKVAADFKTFQGILGQARADIGKAKEDISTLSDAYEAEADQIAALPPIDFFGNAEYNKDGEKAGKGFIQGMKDYFKENGVIAVATALIALIIGGIAAAGLVAIGVTGGIMVALALLVAALVFGLVYWLSDPKNRQKIKDGIVDLFNWAKGVDESLAKWEEGVQQKIKAWWQRQVDEMQQELTGIWGGAIDWVAGIGESLSRSIEGTRKSISEWWDRLVTNVSTYLARRITDAFKFREWIRTAFTRDEEPSKTEGRTISSRIMDAIVGALKSRFLGTFSLTGLFRSLFDRDRAQTSTDAQTTGENMGTRLRNGILTALGSLGRLLYESISGAMRGLPTWVKGPINSVLALWNRFIESMAQLNIVIGGGEFAGIKLPRLAIDLGALRNFKIPMLASGGITTGPMNAIIGESGSEAVIPLDELWRKFEPLFSMAEAMSELAANTGSVAGGNTYNTNVYVETDADPYEIGREILWNNMTRVR